MSAFVRRCLPPRPAQWVGRALLPLAVWGVLCGQAPGQGAASTPPPAYFLQLPLYYNGEYLAAEQSLQVFLQGAIKNPAAGGLWIDSICYETMRGECAYQMGNHAVAYLHYQAALRLLINFNNWMLSVQFPPVVLPAAPQNVPAVPWYFTQRQTVIGGYPPTMNIMQGRINNNMAVRFGGIVQQPVLLPLNVQEIVRCSCLALRRWRELLGPTCPHNEMTRELVTVLGMRPALPNHWSEAWVDVELGLAYAAAGKNAQARKTLQKAELAMGQFDHPFTGTVLLELGRLDMEAGDFKSAERNFLEASWSAAIFSNIGVVEEALRYGAQLHQMTKGHTPYVPLVAATAWAAAQGFGQLNASLLLSGAENQSSMNQPAAAATLLTQATVLTSGTNMPLGKIGARMNHLRAITSYQSGLVGPGDAALAAAMVFQTGGSLWLYHIGLVDLMWTTKDVTERTAADMYNYVLRDPTPTDWLTDPLESLSVLTVPHPLSYENWFEAALARKSKEHEQTLEIADRARRHRFLVTLEEGGRLLNLRWLLEAPPHALDEAAMMQRQAIFAHYPLYEKQSREIKQLRDELRKLPLAIDSQGDEDEKELAAKQSQLLAELAELSKQQEKVLRLVSVRREPSNLVFPPLRNFEQVQKSLAEGQSLLVFYSASRFTYAFLVGKDKYTSWEIKASIKKFQKDLSNMLRAWGNFEQNKELKLDELSEKWREPAQAIMDAIVKNSKADFTKAKDELVIVPDGMLWYLPFETLPVSDGDHAELLIDKVRVRYAPTVGLAVGDRRSRKPDQNMAVVLGRLYPRDEEDVVELAFEGIARAVPGATAIRGKLPAAGSIYSSLFDRLIVLSEITPATVPGFNWAPVQTDKKTPGGTLGQWLGLPFGGPDQVILPGFRTPAERGMHKMWKGTAGDDLFFSTCGLMASGARTVLISRWRTGGQSSVDLVREFAQELPHTTASDAWQRSVQLVSHAEVNAGAEPRLKLNSKQTAPTAEHPFFWAGYLLVDSGARPMGDDEEEAVEQVLAAIAEPGDKPLGAGQKPAAMGAAADQDKMKGDREEAGLNAGQRGAANVAAQAKPPRVDAGFVPADGGFTGGQPGKPAPKARRTRPPRGTRNKAAAKSKQAPVPQQQPDFN